MTSPQKLQPLSSTHAFLTRSDATPRESVIGSGAVLVAVSAIACAVVLRWVGRSVRG